MIAIADDDDAHAEVVCAWVGALGYEVVRFETGDALLAWAGESAVVPAAVLLDVEMPGRDGFTTCAELRRLPAFAEVPCVLVSGLGEGQLGEGVRTAGASGSIRKDATLLSRLAAWLRHAVPLPLAPRVAGAA